MFKIVMNKIYLTEGDTARFNIGLQDTTYELSNADSIYFIVTTTPEIIAIADLGVDTTKYVFFKQGTSIVINPSDTLGLVKDTYYYQVRVVLGQSGDTNTIIEPTEFVITPLNRMV